MNSIAARLARCGDDRGAVEISGGAGAGDRDRTVRHPRVQRLRIVGRIDRDRADPHFGGGARDADRDLAAIGDEKFCDCFFHDAKTSQTTI